MADTDHRGSLVNRKLLSEGEGLEPTGIELIGKTVVMLRLTASQEIDIGPRLGEPVTCGVPWPRGLLADTQHLVLLDESDRPIPSQFDVLDRWPDGTVRWLLVDFQASTSTCRLVSTTTTSEHAFPEHPVSCDEDAGGAIVNTGVAQFEIRKTLRDSKIMSVLSDGAPCADVAFDVIDQNNIKFAPAVERVTVPTRGPLRTVVHLEGSLRHEGSDPLHDLAIELHFFAGSAAVRGELTMINRRAAGHPGGKWVLGSEGSVFLRDASLKFTLTGESKAGAIGLACQADAPIQNVNEPFELYQDSSGGENWNSRNHLNRDDRIPVSFCGYRLKHGDTECTDLRATPTATLGTQLAVTCPNFWQNFPKTLEANDSAITLRLFPKQFGDVHELQGGEQKTHTFCCAFGKDTVTEKPLAWVHAPLIAHANPDWYAKSQAVAHLLSGAGDPHPKHQALINSAIEGNDTFETKREFIDEYGWRHFGEVYADHESRYFKGEPPVLSHYNNQYDGIAGFATQFMRSGNPRWWNQMCELAKHVIDIDIYHTTNDKAAYNRGLFWHTFHYIDADTSTHRSYPPSDEVPGGGPSTGHIYSSGLMLFHFMTGHAAARQTTIDLGQYVIDADDGNKTVFRFLDRGCTGHVSLSYTDYHGPGRSPGNAVITLINAHRMTGERRFLDKAEQLIRRCIHPNDDLEKRDLTNIEGRWFYTVFLQALGRYLDYKIAIQENDRMYHYGRTALLHYTSWAVAHEYPYLEKPEILEYPTETWAAQDMRKCEMFLYAARHAENENREALLERAGFFFHASVDQLADLPTHTFARPTILMMNHGMMYCWHKLHGLDSAPQPEVRDIDFGDPEVFVPQKIRARKKAIMLAAGAALSAAAMGVWVISKALF